MEAYDYFADFLTKFYGYFDRVIKIFTMYTATYDSQVYTVCDFPIIDVMQVEVLVNANVKSAQTVINCKILTSISENLEYIKMSINDIFAQLVEKVNLINKGSGILDNNYYNQLKNELKLILFEGNDKMTAGLEKCILNVNNGIYDFQFKDIPDIRK